MDDGIESMKIEVVDQIGGSRATPIAVAGWHYLHQNGLVNNNTWAVNWDDEAIIGVNLADRPIAILIFSHQKWLKTIYVKLGYVEADFRRKGVYGKLWEKLVEIAQERNVPYIEGATMLQNAAMRSQAKQMDRVEYGVMLRYEVKPKPPVKTGSA